GRHPTKRTRMAVVAHGNPKPATTHYKTLDHFLKTTYLEVELETGRTHQIRVHMQHIGHPVFGDPVYGQREPNFPRQALHAKSLSLIHPSSQEPMHWEAPLPQDFAALIQAFSSEAHA
ncbi:MAG: RluA family pseudouridine synthase, partial [Gammaproteobacteria bacterium]